jgi:CHAD domain-containing protein
VTFQLKPDESVKKGVRRIARKQVEKAGQELTGSAGAEAVHAARKRFKKVRAVWRLARPGLGDAVYHRENNCFRSAARPLSQLRDAQALIEAFDKLAEHFAGEADSARWPDVRAGLVEHQKEVAHQVLDEEQSLPRVAELIGPAAERIRDRDLGGGGWRMLSAGLKRIYRAGRQAFAEARKDPSDENLHEWRKQAKYLRHALEVLRPVWEKVVSDLAEQAQDLTDLLGDDHDLVVLRALLQETPQKFGDPEAELFSLLQRRRTELQESAWALGRRAYGEKPKAFVRRLGKYWKAWQAEKEAARAAD